MFCYYDEILNNRDLFNNERARNIHNTDAYFYNCAGYALGTFSWYCPYDDYDIFSLLCDFDALAGAAKLTVATKLTVSHMLKDFEGRLRVISSLKELRKDEYAIAYRVSSDGDFHFMKKARTRWHHKRGNTPTILTESEDNVLNSIWCDRYDGPIVLMAMRRK